MILRILILFLLASPAMGQKEKTYSQKIPGTEMAFTLVAVPGGKFTLGSKSILADSDESPTVEIELSPYWIGEHEVTFAEWDAFFKDSAVPQVKNMDGVTRATPQYIDLTWGMGREPNHPVNSLSQQAALMYCRWLYSKTGIFFRLPTEAEWEYACKAGETKLPDPATVGEYGWFSENSEAKFQLVKQKKPNAWGIYDLLGNLSEWTLDQYEPQGYSALERKDPMVTHGSRYPKAVRGGSFEDPANQLRCSNRIASDPRWNQRDPQVPKSRWWMTDGMFVGFRVVRPARQPSAEEIEQFFARYLK